MTLHLSPPRLPQLDDDPDLPAEGEIALYARDDGRLYRATGDGQLGPVSPWQSVVLAEDALLGADQGDTDVPGLALTLPPGLHHVRAVLNLSSAGTDLILSGMQLLTPDADLVSGELRLAYTPDEFYLYAILGGGSILGDGYTMYPDATTQAVLHLVVNAVDAGQVLLQAASQSTWYEWQFWGEEDIYNWFRNGDFVWVSEPSHNGEGAAQCTPDGSNTVAGLDQSMDAHPEFEYTLTAWLYAEQEWGNAGLRVTFYDDNGDSLGVESTMGPITAGEWTEHTLTLQPPAGTVSASALVGMRGTPPSSAVFYIDDITWTSAGGALKVGAGSFISATPM